MVAGRQPADCRADRAVDALDRRRTPERRSLHPRPPCQGGAPAVVFGPGALFPGDRRQRRRPAVRRLRVRSCRPAGLASVWWSLAVYDTGGELIDNDFRRYALTGDTIVRGANGGYVVRLAKDARPGNWMPVGTDGRFVVMLRAYQPAAAPTSWRGAAVHGNCRPSPRSPADEYRPLLPAQLAAHLRRSHQRRHTPRRRRAGDAAAGNRKRLRGDVAAVAGQRDADVAAGHSRRATAAVHGRGRPLCGVPLRSRRRSDFRAHAARRRILDHFALQSARREFLHAERPATCSGQMSR